MALRSVIKLQLLLTALTQLWISVAGQDVGSTCPILGPIYPAPLALHNDPTFNTTSAKLAQQLDAATSTSQTAWGNILSNISTFSAGVFSLDCPELIYSFDWNAPQMELLPDAKQTTDRDTTYPINSISKLVTVYTLLTEVGFDYWNEPVTQFIPELSQAAADFEQQPGLINRVQWQDVTLGDLASQLGDGPRFSVNSQNLASPVPGLPTPEPLVCSNVLNCTREDFFTNFKQYPPIQAPAAAAHYSDDAFQLLGWALENITGKAFADMVQDNILTPLNMTNSSYRRTPNSQTLILPASDLGFPPVGALFPIDGPSGGVWSSINDLAKLGRSILNSTLLPDALTRRWIKPRSHTADKRKSVGAPWEINRIEVNGRTVDLYAKEGDSGEYTSWLVLIPDYNAGIALAVAQSATAPGAPSFGVVDVGQHILNLIGDVILKGLDDAARDQGAGNFAGKYEGDNATLTLTVDPTNQILGLQITEWHSDGADILEDYLALASAVSLPLQVTNLRDGNQLAFRIIPQNPPSDAPPGTVQPQCNLWIGIDDQARNGQPADLFVFEVDNGGKAVSVAPRLLGEKTLKKVA